MIEIQEAYAQPQGEGPNLGRPSLFLRLHRCNLSCDFCDTPQTWKKSDPEYNDYQTLEEDDALDLMLKTARALPVPPTGLVVTGGEPLIWQRQLADLLPAYVVSMKEQAETNVQIEVETAGTILPRLDLLALCHFNVSHKMPSSKNYAVSTKRLWNEAATRQFLKADAVFKPVIGSSADVAMLEVYLHWLVTQGAVSGLSSRQVLDRVYLLPEGRTRSRLARTQRLVSRLAMQYGTRMTTRAHIISYGSERRR